MDEPLMTARWKRWLWLAAGGCSLLLGIAGTVLPVDLSEAYANGQFHAWGRRCGVYVAKLLDGLESCCKIQPSKDMASLLPALGSVTQELADAFPVFHKTHRDLLGALSRRDWGAGSRREAARAAQRAALPRRAFRHTRIPAIRLRRRAAAFPGSTSGNRTRAPSPLLGLGFSPTLGPRPCALAGRREHEGEITIADLTGVGVQDAAIAATVVETLGL